MRAIVFAPTGSSNAKLAHLERLGADVRLGGADVDEAKDAARAYARGRELPFFEDGAEPIQYEAYGAIADEIVEQLERPPGAVVVPIGNGALAGGIGRALGTRSPATLRVGVVSKEAPVMALSWEARRPVTSDRCATIADGLAVRVAIPYAVEALNETVDRMLQVSERAIARAVAAFDAAGIRAEPAAGAALAALEQLDDVDGADRPDRDRRQHRRGTARPLPRRSRVVSCLSGSQSPAGPGIMLTAMYPKIELHVHLEGTVQPRTLLELARRNDVALPADTAEGLQELFTFTDLAHFIDVWFMVTTALQTADDFRRITVDYAEEAARHGAVYIEGIFAPTVPARNGIPLEAMFDGYCDGVQEARERLGVEVRLTPDLNRTSPPEEAARIVQHAIDRRERGVVGVGLGGVEDAGAARAIRRRVPAGPRGRARLGSARRRGPRPAVDLGRARGTAAPIASATGSASLEDPALVRELLDRGTVLDVCPTANVCVGAVPSYDEHPLPEMVAAGLRCSLSTDDPAMFGIDLTSEYGEAAAPRARAAREFYEVGVEGALCDEPTRAALRAIGDDFDWASLEAAPVTGQPTSRLPRDSRHATGSRDCPSDMAGGRTGGSLRTVRPRRTPRRARRRPARTARRRRRDPRRRRSGPCGRARRARSSCGRRRRSGGTGRSGARGGRRRRRGRRA